MMLKKRYPSVAVLVIIISASIFVAEALVMIILHFMPEMPQYATVFIDASLLTLMSLPVLYFFAYKPMVLYIGELKQAEKELRKVTKEQEISISERTTELKNANEKLLVQLNETEQRQESLNRQKQETDASRMAIKNVAEDLRRSKETLEEQKISLENINKELDDFTYIVSHDLKEPLRSIDAFSKFIADDYKDKLDEQGRFYIERVRLNASRMQSLIEDLLEISRIERKKNIFEEVDAEDVINEVNLRLEYRIKEKNARITIRNELPKVYCDRVRLTEVFANLLSNALKYSDKPDPQIEIGSNLKDDFQEFFVKDNGPGIEEQYFGKVFEIFQRLGKREDNEGTGAGLTIVKKIVQLHKGRIWIESKVGEYTTFYFTIPTKEKLMSGLGRKKIGEILMEKDLLTEEQLKEALEEQAGFAHNKQKGGANG